MEWICIFIFVLMEQCNYWRLWQCIMWWIGERNTELKKTTKCENAKQQENMAHSIVYHHQEFCWYWSVFVTRWWHCSRLCECNALSPAQAVLWPQLFSPSSPATYTQVIHNLVKEKPQHLLVGSCWQCSMLVMHFLVIELQQNVRPQASHCFFYS